MRMSSEQHRRVAIEAAEQRVSINQLLVSRI
ncbi:toxin-antitoxin system HicB family antitoxin [Gordonibacter sp. ResAG-26]|uniref:Toxin-antitoxin system HicB family antitoxin n=1 Tax=Gordonibacter urolithinfaciens TaxID=1335613 RepID=A0A6N8IH03_9ACTN|nr:type II toxin-antitoxin system HicB family antitoxin [Gordonibacter sp. RACS_AR68]MVM54280.1 toxin-antitoxin system HicB family antitoxin [Gordonibacter urolithinfaciens]MVN14536.1 toxin-antitoxin system HicB family antitoxin [Gordonibacter urolithinfaciens]MVN37673.1 toxin-antitoxin system HicB family antitoxin [Gordonibacter urolithinfaciens]MVN56331.1 toxin-antitoxin system HicB family antitoxin [Gordonibacter urolithinfaciens]